MFMKYLQNIGKSLMLPVSVLPAAALMLGIGYFIDSDGWGAYNAFAALLVTTGDAILSNLGLLFALGVSYGMSKDRDGSVIIAGIVGWLVTTTLLAPGNVVNLVGELSESHQLAFSQIENVFVGIILGCIIAAIYNRYSKTELPMALAFFSGRRLVPILSTFAAVIFSGILLFVWPPVFSVLLAFGETISGMGAFGAGLYGFFNRLLIPTGLHHALNAVFWFDFAGINDLRNFWGAGAGVIGETGRYMAGFYPVMMFGLPGACLAMYRQAKPKHKTRVYGLLFAAAVTSFITGVTEPIEFSFMFVAPILYLIHALLTGISMFVIYSLGWISGFAFSAGAIDMILASSSPFAVNWYFIPIAGVIYFFLYYFIFSFVIKKFNLKTPGREDEDFEEEHQIDLKNNDWTAMANDFLEGLGGRENVVNVDNCATRLRIEVKDTTLVQDKKIKAAGAAGIIKPSKTSVQVIVGPKVQMVADELNNIL